MLILLQDCFKVLAKITKLYTLQKGEDIGVVSEDILQVFGLLLPSK